MSITGKVDADDVERESVQQQQLIQESVVDLNTETEDQQNGSPDLSIIAEYGNFTMEQILQMQQSFTSVMLMASAYYYPELMHLLDENSTQIVLSWNRDIVNSMVDTMREEEKALLLQLAPLVIQYNSDTSLLMDNSGTSEEDKAESDDQEPSTDALEQSGLDMSNQMVAAAASSGSSDIKYSLKDAIFDYKHNIDSDVDPTMRAFHQRDVDVFLPGREGLDISLVRSYDSNSSFAAEPQYGCLPIISYNPCGTTVNTIPGNPVTTDINYIAGGWSLNIPTMKLSGYVDMGEQIRNNYPLPNYPTGILISSIGLNIAFYSFTIEDGTTYRFLSDQRNKSISHPYEDARMGESVYNSANSRWETKLYLNNDQLIYTFGSDGRLLEKANAFGDKVTYTYNEPWNENWSTTIKDSLNQKIVIERNSSTNRIIGIAVYDSSNVLLKHIVYNADFIAIQKNISLNGASYGNNSFRPINYFQLSSVSDVINNRVLKTYTYYDPTETVVDFNFSDYWLMPYDGTKIILDVTDSDGTTKIESSFADEHDRSTYGEALSLLLKEVTDDTGFKTTVQYKTFDRSWRWYNTFKERDQRRGTIRSYIDNYLLKYIGYLPVVNVYYSYTNSDNATKSLQMSVTTDTTNKANEIWLRPKQNITETPYSNYLPKNRLEQAGGYRSGDKVNTAFTYYYGDFTKKTNYAFSATKLGQFQLDSVTNETAALSNGLSLNDGASQYSYAPKQTVSYQYDDGKTKPYLIKTFGEGVAGDTTPAAIKTFLKSGNSRTLPSNLGNYSTLVKQEYDAYGFIIYQVDAAGNVTESQYTGPFRKVSLVKNTSSDGLTVVENNYTYNADGTLKTAKTISKYRNPNNSTQTLQDTTTTDYVSYTASRLPTKIVETSSGAQYSTNASTTEQTLEYDAKLLNVTKQTVKAKLGDGQAQTALSTQYQYDAFNRLIKVTYPDNSKAEYTYDYKDRILTDKFTPTVTTASPRTTSYSYDDANRIVTMVSPDGESTLTRYTPFGEVDVQTRQVTGSASRIVLKNEYDSSGVLLKETKPYNDNNQKTSYVYGKNGELSTLTNPLGQQTKYYYSNAVYAINGSSSTLQSTVKVIEPDGKETWSYSDKLGQLVKNQEQSATKLRLTTNRYTPFGYLTNQTVTANGINQSTSYAYDAIGNLIHVTDSLGQNYDYVNNSAGQVTNVKVDGVTQRNYLFNEIGTLLKKTNAAGLSELYTYKNNGLLNQYTDENGFIHIYAYTDYNEPSQESIKNASGTEVYWRKYTYDPTTRQLTGVTTKDNENLSYHYDQWKRMDKQTVAGKSYILGYDSYDRLTQMTYPDNKAVTYTYDKLSRLQTVSYPDMGTVTYAYETSNNQNKYSISSPNGMTQTRLTDAFDELTSVKVTNGSSSNVWSETFGYDGMGNISSIDRNGTRFDFKYDDLNRIKNETSVGLNLNNTYSYDKKGNILTIGDQNYSYNVLNQISTYTSPTVNKTYTYDARGNTLSIANQNYSYNALDQLSTYASPTATASYTYYGDGLRATKTVNGVKTRYVYLNGHVIEELDTSGNTIGRNIWGNELLYRKDVASNKAGYYTYNGHGDVVEIRDNTGAILNSYDYDIWGNIISKVERMSNPFKYTGEIYDDESGLIYLRARYYNPVDKRFINKDTYEGDITNPLTSNLYTYVTNNPIKYFDPSGHEGIVVSGGDYSVDSHGGYSYNFIEPALKKIMELREANPNETIAWLIADAGWSDEDWANFSEAVSSLNVNIVKLSSADDFINYINNKTGGNSRMNDKITSFTVFSHGLTGMIPLGYNYSSSYNQNLNLTIANIQYINSNAFSDPTSWFYSCNTGTGGSQSFAQAWVNQVGGTTWAYEGKTTYQYMMYPREYFSWKAKVNRALGGKWSTYAEFVDLARMSYGFSSTGSARYPEATGGATLLKFT
ncbi:RHS repeat protein [Paenibacillus sp. PR3]|uniref:RHS repeat protein n=2 Tax=Paenibacillus terricola TaxID=2763503 RepID=A0ABR8MXI2_9BACL|nr:RHS repeat protein [Paenibacillus terricola]